VIHVTRWGGAWGLGLGYGSTPASSGVATAFQKIILSRTPERQTSLQVSARLLAKIQRNLVAGRQKLMPPKVLPFKDDNALAVLALAKDC
jgi:hypothetical protein